MYDRVGSPRARVGAARCAADGPHPHGAEMPEVPDGVFELVRTICTVRVALCRSRPPKTLRRRGTAALPRCLAPPPSGVGRAHPHEGAAQLSGIKVVADTILLAATDLYRDKCPRCRGAGTTTCQLCKGSKTLRARPARLVQTASGANMLLHLPDALHECWYCGPYCKVSHTLTRLLHRSVLERPCCGGPSSARGRRCTHEEFCGEASCIAPSSAARTLEPRTPRSRVQLDFDLNCQDINDQVDSIRIMENLSSAMSGRPTPFSFGPTAGTVPCTMCMGSRHMGRFTPNLGKVFGLEDDYWTQARPAGRHVYCCSEIFALARAIAALRMALGAAATQPGSSVGADRQHGRGPHQPAAPSVSSEAAPSASLPGVPAEGARLGLGHLVSGSFCQPDPRDAPGPRCGPRSREQRAL